MVVVSPGSLAVGVDPTGPLVFTFSEKVDRRGFRSSLLLAPQRRLREIRFKGERVIVRPEEPWPKDTLVVWTLLPDLKDRHGVKLGRPLSGAFTTGDSIPRGWIRGQAVGKDLDFSRVMAVLRTMPEEGKRLGVLWRMAAANELGFFRLGPLKAPSGPYDLEVFLDKNGNGKRDEHEPVGGIDSLLLPVEPSPYELGELELIDLEQPVPFVLCFQSEQADSLTVVVSLRPLGRENAKLRTAPTDSSGCIRTQLVPGEYKVAAWVDLDGDGGFGVGPEGMSEPFTAEQELTLVPAKAESLQWRRPEERLSWAVIDTMRTPPLPRETFSEERATELGPRSRR